MPSTEHSIKKVGDYIKTNCKTSRVHHVGKYSSTLPSFIWVKGENSSALCDPETLTMTPFIFDDNRCFLACSANLISDEVEKPIHVKDEYGH